MTRSDDAALVTALLGRPPQGRFAVVVRRGDGTPMVIRNDPLLDDGTPMPTLYWLVDPDLRREIGRLESEGGVARAEAEIDPEQVARAHRAYAAERDATVPSDHDGPRPSGGVGGTRRGIKCLHAHYAWFLVGRGDPVGRWVHSKLPRAANLTAPDRPRPDPSESPK